MYDKLPNLVLGFHGCANRTKEAILVQREPLKFSQNAYDWLGSGMYFWEQNLTRAILWANELHGDEAAVIGAVIDMGYCLNLLDSKCIRRVRDHYSEMKEEKTLGGKAMPLNRNARGDSDYLLRDLDCMVIESLHQKMRENGEEPYDTVRGVFIEGGRIYPTAGIFEKSHIQICVRNPNCIKGFFDPRDTDGNYQDP